MFTRIPFPKEGRFSPCAKRVPTAVAVLAFAQQPRHWGVFLCPLLVDSKPDPSPTAFWEVQSSQGVTWLGWGTPLLVVAAGKGLQDVGQGVLNTLRSPLVGEDF